MGWVGEDGSTHKKSPPSLIETERFSSTQTDLRGLHLPALVQQRAVDHLQELQLLLLLRALVVGFVHVCVLGAAWLTLSHCVGGDRSIGRDCLAPVFWG